MQRKVLLMLLVFAFLVNPCLAAKSVGYEEVACTSTVANKLTVATINSLKATYPDLWATVQVADYPVGWLTSGTPTSATKKVAQVGDIFWLETLTDLTSFRGIGIGGTSNLAITYYTGAAR